MGIVKHPLSRRKLLTFTLALAGTGAAGAGGLAAFLDSRDDTDGPGEVVLEPGELPAPGAAPLLVKGHPAWLVILPAGADTQAPFTPPSPGGFLVLSRSCTCQPNPGCSVPWLDDYDFRGARGWFRCPCHGSVWSLSGTRVKGPATALRTYPAWVDADGRLHIDLTAPSLAPANTLAVAKRRT